LQAVAELRPQLAAAFSKAAELMNEAQLALAAYVALAMQAEQLGLWTWCPNQLQVRQLEALAGSMRRPVEIGGGK
jgi:hypothetical protein